MNAGLLDIICRAFPDQRVRFLAERRHLEEIARLMPSTGERMLESSDIAIPPRQIDPPLRIVADGKFVARLLAGVPRAERTLVVFLSGLSSLIIATRIFREIACRRAVIQIVLHGYLNEVAGWRSRNPLRRALDLRSALAFGNMHTMQLIVLEHSIKKKLHELVPHLANRICALPHPVLPVSPGAAQSWDATKPIRIGFVGLATAEKGFSIFCATAVAVKKRCGARVQFHAIGTWPRGAKVPPLPELDSNPRDGWLSREEYEELLRSMHYVCLPYQGAYYELSASGAVIDALTFEKPLLALHTPAVVDLFSAGNIGFMCDDTVALIDRIASLIETPNEQLYLDQVQAMRMAKARRLPASLAPEYRHFTSHLLHR